MPSWIQMITAIRLRRNQHKALNYPKPVHTLLAARLGNTHTCMLTVTLVECPGLCSQPTRRKRRMIIDSHTHLGRNEHIKSTAKELLKSMDAAKIDKALVFAGEMNDCPNSWMLEQIKKHRDR